MIQKAFWTLLILFLHVAGLKLYGMEKEAEIIMPAMPLAELLATFKETDIPQPRAVTGRVTIEDGGKETIARSAAELSGTVKEVISEVGVEQPIPIGLTEQVFTKFLESLKALDTIKATDVQEYGQALVKVLAPILSGVSLENMLALLSESNRLEVKPLAWYIKALFASKLYATKDINQVAIVSKSLNLLFDVRDEIAKMLESLLPNSLVAWEFLIPLGYIELALKMIPNKGILALIGTAQARFYLWNLVKSTQEIQKQIKVERGSAAVDMSISANGTKAVIINYDDMIQFWDLESGTLLEEFANGKMASVTFSPDGVYALTGLEDGTLNLWDLKKGLVKVFKGHANSVVAVAISCDNNYALSGSWDDTAKLWDLKKETAIKTLEGHTGSVFTVEFSFDGKWALTGSEDKTAILWDLTQEGQQLKPYKILKGHAESVNSVAFSPDSKYALTGSADKTARYWNLETGETIAVYKSGAAVKPVIISSNGEFGLLGVKAGSPIVLWSLKPHLTLPEIVMFIKLNQLGKDEAIQGPYFEALYNKLLGY